MGGQREQVLNTPATSSHKIPVQINGIRIHENNGEVHLHDDARKLKVAIPSSEFWKAWNQSSEAKSSGNKVIRTISFIDPKNQSVALIENTITFENKKASVNTTVRLEKAEFDGNYTKLQTFVAGS